MLFEFCETRVSAMCDASTELEAETFRMLFDQKISMR